MEGFALGGTVHLVSLQPEDCPHHGRLRQDQRGRLPHPPADRCGRGPSRPLWGAKNRLPVRLLLIGYARCARRIRYCQAPLFICSYTAEPGTARKLSIIASCPPNACARVAATSSQEASTFGVMSRSLRILNPSGSSSARTSSHRSTGSRSV